MGLLSIADTNLIGSYAVLSIPSSASSLACGSSKLLSLSLLSESPPPPPNDLKKPVVVLDVFAADIAGAGFLVCEGPFLESRALMSIGPSLRDYSIPLIWIEFLRSVIPNLYETSFSRCGYLGMYF